LLILFQHQVQKVTFLNLSLCRSVYFPNLLAEYAHSQDLNNLFLWTDASELLKPFQCENVLLQGLDACGSVGQVCLFYQVMGKRRVELEVVVLLWAFD
jgi:hypothetical protein